MLAAIDHVACLFVARRISIFPIFTWRRHPKIFLEEKLEMVFYIPVGRRYSVYNFYLYTDTDNE